MSVTVPPTPAALPTPPSTSDPVNFDTRADAFNAAMPAFQSGVQSLADNAYANAVDAAASTDAAAASASNASASAIAAAASAGAAIWVSGTTYAIGDVRYSPANGAVYRRLTSGAGTTDPRADTTNWGPAIPASPASAIFLATNFGAL